jgi:hypothetical protein
MGDKRTLKGRGRSRLWKEDFEAGTGNKSNSIFPIIDYNFSLLPSFLHLLSSQLRVSLSYLSLILRINEQISRCKIFLGKVIVTDLGKKIIFLVVLKDTP